MEPVIEARCAFEYFTLESMEIIKILWIGKPVSYVRLLRRVWIGALCWMEKRGVLYHFCRFKLLIRGIESAVEDIQNCACNLTLFECCPIILNDMFENFYVKSSLPAVQNLWVYDRQ